MSAELIKGIDPAVLDGIVADVEERGSTTRLGLTNVDGDVVYPYLSGLGPTGRFDFIASISERRTGNGSTRWRVLEAVSYPDQGDGLYMRIVQSREPDGSGPLEVVNVRGRGATPDGLRELAAKVNAAPPRPQLVRRQAA